MVHVSITRERTGPGYPHSFLRVAFISRSNCLTVWTQVNTHVTFHIRKFKIQSEKQQKRDIGSSLVSDAWCLRDVAASMRRCHVGADEYESETG